VEDIRLHLSSSKYSSEQPGTTFLKDMVAITKGLTNEGFEAFRSITALYADAWVTKASKAL